MERGAVCRTLVRAEICLTPGWLRVAPMSSSESPAATVRLGPDGVPSEMPTCLLPPDLRTVGAVFWMLFDPARHEAVGFERV